MHDVNTPSASQRGTAELHRARRKNYLDPERSNSSWIDRARHVSGHGTNGGVLRRRGLVQPRLSRPTATELFGDKQNPADALYGRYTEPVKAHQTEAATALFGLVDRPPGPSSSRAGRWLDRWAPPGDGRCWGLPWQACSSAAKPPLPPSVPPPKPWISHHAILPTYVPQEKGTGAGPFLFRPPPAHPASVTVSGLLFALDRLPFFPPPPVHSFILSLSIPLFSPPCSIPVLG